jgi:Cu/Ag efflux protein CusF
MKIWTRFGVAIAAPILLWSGTALGQSVNPPAHQGATPRMVEGQVVKIDRTQGRVTIRATDGTMHEFQASKETLQDLKEGDRIEARLRQP